MLKTSSPDDYLYALLCTVPSVERVIVMRVLGAEPGVGLTELLATGFSEVPGSKLPLVSGGLRRST
ncbi:hypothetical protein [Streptomyces decoyicus]